MHRTRSLLRQAPAIIIALIALTIALGGGAYASTRSAPHTRVVPLAVTFSALTLQNGWVSSNSTYATGNPRVSIQNGIVYLSGSLHQPTPGSAIFALLPSSYRPAHNMYITVYTNGGTSGTLYIGHDGTMEAFSSATCGSGSAAQCFTSLATVSYPNNS